MSLRPYRLKMYAKWRAADQRRYRRGNAVDIGDWVRRIEAIEKRHGLKAAIKCACIVWWDHLGDQPATDERTRLHHWISRYRYDESTEPTQGHLVNYLVELGYSRERAEFRARRTKISSASRSIRKEREIQNQVRRNIAQGQDGHVGCADQRHQEDPGAASMGSVSEV